jgi:hypothetical protein
MPQSTTPIHINIIIISPFSHPFMFHALRKKEKKSATTFSLHSSMEMPSSPF